jgi:iron complex transport system ATP-binding protein
MVLMGRHPHQDSVFFDSEEDVRIAEEALALLDMAGFRQRLFRTLSGGEKQRVAIAAALAQKAPVILFDEPTAYTDIRYQSGIYRLIHDITKQSRLTSVIVTHDINLASLYCDRVSVLHGGVITASGAPSDILTEKLLAETYGSAVRVISHPEEHIPLVIPVFERKHA